MWTDVTGDMKRPNDYQIRHAAFVGARRAVPFYSAELLLCQSVMADFDRQSSVG
ncbi:MAG TPA: hypothetical protein VNN62_12795 [Methylomirabilota bacterium]|nr:hypothetical protein [Methylomirabilota bacterium]